MSVLAATPLSDALPDAPLPKRPDGKEHSRMPLKVEIKPGERVIIGDALVTNNGQRAKLFIEGQAPILREKDIMRADEADTPCKKIYLMIQMMYLSPDPKQHFDLYFKLVKDVQQAAPSMLPQIEAVNNELLTGAYYKALKETKKLIAYEKELMDNARSR
jgi:flagellar protein FlbT